MPVRLLLVVLMLTGMVPARVCTCAAAAHSDFEHDQHLCPEASGECQHHDDGSIPGDHDHDRQPHERDCPAANPLTIVVAVPAASPEIPAATDLVFAKDYVPFSIHSITLLVRPTSVLHFGALPRYLALLTIRI